MNIAVRNLHDDDSLTMNQFRIVCEEIASMAQKENLTITPYSHPSLPYFKELDSAKRKEALASIEIYASILRMTLSAGHKLMESKQLSWNAFKMLKLRPTSDFFSHITENSVVEIYTSTGIQIFRNCQFFEICSYTLEDLYCRPWFELFERDSQVIEKIGKHVAYVLSNNQKSCYFPEIGPHVLAEKDSPFKYRIQLEIDCIATVVDEAGDSSTHFAAIETVDVVNKLTSKEKNRFLEEYYSKKELEM